MGNVPMFPGDRTIPDANVALYQELFRTLFERDAEYLSDENINRDGGNEQASKEEVGGP
jgi:hypothetical protein